MKRETFLKRSKDRTWWAYTVWNDGKEVVAQVQTVSLDGSPRSTYSEKKPGYNALTWDYPHALGYVLGFDVKATKRTIEMAHKAALERMYTIRPELK